MQKEQIVIIKFNSNETSSALLQQKTTTLKDKILTTWSLTNSAKECFTYHTSLVILVLSNPEDK